MFILGVVPLDPFGGNGNPSQRLSEIRSKIGDAENRVRTLEALLTDLILHPDYDVTQQILGKPDADFNAPGFQFDVDSTLRITNPDAQNVRQALYAARAYEGELRTAEQFWNQIVESNKQAEKDTHDLFKRA